MMARSLRRVWIQLTADRKRFGVLCTAAAIGLLFWARLIIVSNVTRTAIADPKSPKTASVAALSHASASSAGREKAAVSSGKSNKHTARIALVNIPGRDPFVINPQYFPKPTPPAPLPKDESKSVAKPVEEPEQIAARRFAWLQQIAGSFRLEAALGSSVAVINGKTCRAGDVLEGKDSGSGKDGRDSESVRFRLEEVKQRSVILEVEGYRFELQMTSPGG